MELQRDGGTSQQSLRRLHMIFGAIQMVIGPLCFLIEASVLSINTLFAGELCGICIFVSGILGYFAGKKNSFPCLIACMVMNIITTILIGIVLILVVILHTTTPILSAMSLSYSRAKMVVLGLIFVFEFVFTIVHSSLTCHSACHCCEPIAEIIRTHTRRSLP